MEIFKAAFHPENTVESQDFLYIDDWDEQLKKIEKLEQEIILEIEDYRMARKKSKIDNLKLLETVYLNQARVILTTLMTGASGKLRDRLKLDVDYLIIDEACQAIEPMCLLPMVWNPKVIILVGDHKQLPATTFSPNAS